MLGTNRCRNKHILPCLLLWSQHISLEKAHLCPNISLPTDIKNAVYGDVFYYCVFLQFLCLRAEISWTTHKQWVILVKCVTNHSRGKKDTHDLNNKNVSNRIWNFESESDRTSVTFSQIRQIKKCTRDRSRFERMTMKISSIMIITARI